MWNCTNVRLTFIQQNKFSHLHILTFSNLYYGKSSKNGDQDQGPESSR